jgi:hypothetical protein
VALPCVGLVDALKEVLAQGVRHATRGLQRRHVRVQKEPVRAVDRETHMAVEDVVAVITVDIAAACPHEDQLCQAVTLSLNRVPSGRGREVCPPPAKIQT